MGRRSKYSYQDEAIARAEGKDRVLFVAPTGAGKGTMAAKMLADVARREGRALFIIHSRDIAIDIARRVRKLRVRVGMNLPGHEPDESAPVQVATVQSLAKRELRRRFDLVIVDEAHHYRAKDWEKVLKRVKRKRLVGFTATPQRADGKGLGEVFEHLETVITYSELLKLGLIVPCRVKAPPYRLDGATAMEPAEAYLEHARGSFAFIFVRSLGSAESVRDKLRAAGITAEVIHDKTPHKTRTAHVDAMREGKLQVIVNYGTMTEGIDVPRVSTIVLEQTCQHMGSYIQRVGRALRTFPGKTEALLIDLSGACWRHGMPMRDVPWQLSKDAPVGDAGEVVRRAPSRSQAVVDGCGLVDVDGEYLAANGGPRFIDWGALGIGKRPDKDVARDAMVSVPLVCKVRRQLGIQTFSAFRLSQAAGDVLSGMSIGMAAKRHGVDQASLSGFLERTGQKPANQVEIANLKREAACTDVLVHRMSVAAAARKHRTDPNALAAELRRRGWLSPVEIANESAAMAADAVICEGVSVSCAVRRFGSHKGKIARELRSRGYEMVRRGRQRGGKSPVVWVRKSEAAE